MRAGSPLSLWLRTEGPGPMIGHATLVYGPGGPNYDSVLEHLGPISPGERKLVPCSPDS